MDTVEGIVHMASFQTTEIIVTLVNWREPPQKDLSQFLKTWTGPTNVSARTLVLEPKSRNVS